MYLMSGYILLLFCAHAQWVKWLVLYVCHLHKNCQFWKCLNLNIGDKCFQNVSRVDFFVVVVVLFGQLYSTSASNLDFVPQGHLSTTPRKRMHKLCNINIHDTKPWPWLQHGCNERHTVMSKKLMTKWPSVGQRLQRKDTQANLAARQT